MKINLKCKLENIVQNIDGSISYYFKQEKTDLKTSNKIIQEIKNCQESAKNDLEITIDKYRKQRSLDANAYFHLLVHKLAEYYNEGNDFVKIKMNLEYGTPAVDEDGNQVIIKLPETVDITKFYEYAKFLGQKKEKNYNCNYYIFYKRTHLLNSKEMARLIDGVVRECQDVGIETKTPEQIAEMLNLWEQMNNEDKKK